MFKGWSLRKKVSMGFGTILVLLGGVTGWSLWGIGGIVSNAGEVIDGNVIKGLLVEKEVDHLHWAGQVAELINNADVTTLNVQTDPHRCAFGQWYYGEERREAEAKVPGLSDVLARIEEPHKRLHGTAEQIAAVYAPADLELGNFLRETKTAHLVWLHQIKDVFIHRGQELNVQTDPHKCTLGKWLYADATVARTRQDPDFGGIWVRIEADHARLHGGAVEIKEQLARDDFTGAQDGYYQNIEPNANLVVAGIDDFLVYQQREVAGMLRAAEIYAQETTPALHEVESLLGEAEDIVSANVMTDKEMLARARETRAGVMVLAGVAITLGLLLGFVITRSIVTVLTRVMEELGFGAEQVAAASNQVAQASQDMAEGASEQASSLEETAATIEEMSSMTSANAGHAAEASRLTGDLRGAAQSGQQAMSRMTGAIEKIKGSADETAQIVKTIDEIAFQTNLLALNAAVEAARAGDAGRGFAVVAEEVRNLAKRSAEAAQDTAELIATSQNNALSGVAVTHDVTRTLSEVVAGIDKVGSLIDQVSDATERQSRGIGEINTAVGQLENLTQNGAANAEESASASEELSGQARELNRMVGELAAVITGCSGGGAPQSAAAPLSLNRTAWGSGGRHSRDESVVPCEEEELTWV